jgi:CHASE2 domain-containing sensor protein
MVRERVGDWRLAWRFALAGLLAGILVAAISSLGLINGPFYAAQDQLFPAPPPDQGVTFVAVDQHSADKLGAFPWLNSYHATVINYLASLHPKVILFDVMLDHDTGPDPETKAETNGPLIKAIKAAGNVVLVCTANSSPRPDFATAAAAVGERGLANPDYANAVRGVVLRPSPDKTCVENEADEPAFLQALRIAEGIDAPLTVDNGVANFGQHRIPLVGDQMLINFTKGVASTCSYVDAFNANCPDPSTITGHIVVVGTKLIDAGDVYPQAVGFHHDPSFCPDVRPSCMLDSQNYGYRIQGDAMSTILNDRYIRVQPAASILSSIFILSLLIASVVYVLSFQVALIFTGALLAAYYGAILLLGKAGYLADPLYAPIAIILSASFAMAARYVL